MFGLYLRRILIITFFGIVLFFYLRNITHDIYSGDIGDLATAALSFGVPHPPGYPTFTVLGFLLSKLPLPWPPVSKVALVSTIAAFSGIILYYRYAYQASKSLLVAIFSSSVLAFSYLYWLYAEIPEVFGLSNFFLIAMYYFSWRFYEKKHLHDFYLSVFFVSVSLTNQHAIIATFPGVAILLIPDLWKLVMSSPKPHPLKKRDKHIKRNNPRITILRNIFTVSFIGLLPYAYVFIASATNPQINWMKEPTIANFIRMLLRMDYEFASNLISLQQRFIIMQVYIQSLFTNFSLLIVLMCLLGIAGAYYFHKRVFYALLIGFIVSGPLFIFTIAPEITDQDEFGVLERFFMHSFIIFLFFLPFGLIIMQKIIQRFTIRPAYNVLFLLPLFIVPIQMSHFYGEKTNLSSTTIGNNLARDILSSVSPNAVLFLKSDTPTFNTWYAHYVLHIRPDVELVSRAGDRNNFKKKIISKYRNRVFTSDKKLTVSEEEQILSYAVTDILKERPVFSTYPIPLRSKKHLWMPTGITYQLLAIKDVPKQDKYLEHIQKNIHRMHIAYRDRLISSEQNLITPNIARLYSHVFLAVGDFLFIQYKDPQRAFPYYNFALLIDGDNSAAYAKIGIAQTALPGHCKEAIYYLDEAISMYKIYRPYYTFALKTYKQCDVPKQKIEQLKRAYFVLFGKDLEKDPHY